MSKLLDMAKKFEAESKEKLLSVGPQIPKPCRHVYCWGSPKCLRKLKNTPKSSPTNNEL
ncbi:MbeB family mobilization protein [Vibrio splendidus]|uniref:MbeB family mobilization protein n=1 Tax=Vibrio splendidus TaxID=29497 RepID=UPI00352F71B6